MGFWRTDNPVLETEATAAGVRSIVKGGMFLPQRQWWQLTNKIRLLVGGYGAGKTISLCKWAIATALYNAPAWTALVSPNFPMAKRTIIPTLKKLLAGKAFLRDDFSYEHRPTDHMFILKIKGWPDAHILYLSGDNPDNLKGPNLGCAGIDEPFIQDREVLDQMNARIRDPQARLHALAMTGTPEDLNWGYDIAEGEEAGNYDIGVVHADTRENKALPEDYAPDLIKTYDEKSAEAYIEGKFVSLSTGLVFHAFDKNKHVTSELDILTAEDVTAIGGEHWVGMDFNVNPMAFCVGYTVGDHMHIYAEYEIPNSDTEYAAAMVREHHPWVDTAYPDPAGRQRATQASAGITDFHHLESAGFYVEAPLASWGLRDSYNSVNSSFKNGLLTISPRCKKLIRYYQNYSHIKKNTEQGKAMSHLLDGARYAITYQNPVFRPEPIIQQVEGL